jgi:hypothetical protein
MTGGLAAVVRRPTLRGSHWLGAKFPADRGPVHPDPASDLRLARALLVKFPNLDPVINNQMSVMCGQGSATPLGVI